MRDHVFKDIHQRLGGIKTNHMVDYQLWITQQMYFSLCYISLIKLMKIQTVF